MITYYPQTEGVYIALGLSTDEKPENPTTDSFFVETDTGQTFIVVAGEWVAVASGAGATPNTISNGEVYTINENTQTTYSGQIYVQEGGQIYTESDGVLSWVN